jgi:hypothetical protein
VAGSDVCVDKIWLHRSEDDVYLHFHSPLGDSDYFCFLPLGPGGAGGSTNCVEDFFPEYPNTVIDRDRILHAIWRSSAGGDSAIMYSQTATAATSGDSAVTQAVQIPLTLTHPTLSFVYSLGGGRPGGDARLEARVEGITETTTVFSTTAAGGWALGWADLSPRAGEAVTLTLSAYQAVGEPTLWAWLDEVALGSAYPDAWITLKGPLSAMTDELVRLEITYGNRQPVLAASGQVTLTLPAELSFVSASPPPDATEPMPIWAVGDLAGESGPLKIVVTATMTADYQPDHSVIVLAGLTSQTPEIEYSNNQDYVAIRVGRLLVFPVVPRE